jgi:flotillin
MFGIERVILPVSVFDLDLQAYEAYDKGRLPFVVDVKAFFRITDSNLAAARVSSFEELHSQLKAVVQGAVRSILASNEIEEIMQGRSKFGNEFTLEVDGQLKEWGVATVKNIELMDIRDHKDSQVIQNIMAKKKSHIEMESRLEVAKNMKLAKVAEIEAKREVDLNQQEAQQQVGLRTVEAQQKVEMAEESKKQTVIEQTKLTTSREMEVNRIRATKTAEMNKEVAITKANQDKEVALLDVNRLKDTEVIKAEASLLVRSKAAEADANVKMKNAEADLDVATKKAKGAEAEGLARAVSEKAFLLAPVEAQTTLAKEIGANKSYQEYLISIKRVESEQAIGVEQAKALSGAEIKIIANTGSASSGLKSVSDIFTSQGGTQIGAMLEGLQNTDAGKTVMKKLGLTEETANT